MSDDRRMSDARVAELRRAACYTVSIETLRSMLDEALDALEAAESARDKAQRIATRLQVAELSQVRRAEAAEARAAVEERDTALLRAWGEAWEECAPINDAINKAAIGSEKVARLWAAIRDPQRRKDDAFKAIHERAIALAKEAP